MRIDYAYAADFDRTLRIVEQTTGRIGIWVERDGSAYIAPEDAPAVALAILQAAGIDMDHESVGLSMAARHLRDVVSLSEAREKAEARDKRRDELAKELYVAGYGLDSAVPSYRDASHLAQRAIDRIIELESAS